MARPVSSAASKPRQEDQRIFLHGVDWEHYEALLDMRGEAAGVRITYVEGAVELMSPSRSHEWIKTALARLLEAYAEETGRELDGYGSWTLKDREVDRGAEPDECYALDNPDPDRPDLAIEHSRLLPDLDLPELLGCLEHPTQTQVVRAYRRALRDRGASRSS